MNKLYKCALGLLTAFILSFACFSNADYLDGFEYITTINNTNGNLFAESISTLGLPNSNGLVCFKINSFGGTNRIVVSFNSQNNFRFISESSFLTTLFGCFNYAQQVNNNFIVGNEYGNGINFNMDIYFLKSDFSVINGNPGYTSLECQTEYNLIPIEEVTPNYCALNFGMIDPQECPINQGTGAIIRSNLMINDVPYAQNQNINVFIPDFLSWNLSFNDLYTVIEVEGYNADEEYIENIINQEKLTPTNKDIEEMITGFMTNYFPYLALAIIFLYLARKIFKLFK